MGEAAPGRWIELCLSARGWPGGPVLFVASGWISQYAVQAVGNGAKGARWHGAGPPPLAKARRRRHFAPTEWKLKIRRTLILVVAQVSRRPPFSRRPKHGPSESFDAQRPGYATAHYGAARYGDYRAKQDVGADYARPGAIVSGALARAASYSGAPAPLAPPRGEWRSESLTPRPVYGAGRP